MPGLSGDVGPTLRKEKVKGGPVDIPWWPQYPLREEGGSSRVPGGSRPKVRGHTHKAIIGNRLVSVKTRGHSTSVPRRDCPACRAEARQQAAWSAHEAYWQEIQKIRAAKEGT